METEIVHHQFSLFQTEETYYEFNYVGDSSCGYSKSCFFLIDTFENLDKAKVTQKELKQKSIILPSYGTH